ncbi:MAG: UbiA family prenyltransferase [candidate division Zixibacteria bacterium]|nr:UbiA family prenyltransferase [candidate division Zixibacteria bacterium]
MNIQPYFKLTRFQNNLITFISVLMGGFIGGVTSWRKLLLSALSASLISAGGYVLNDYFDLEIDKINRPLRVLPRGDLSPKKALIFSIFLFLIGFILSFFLKPVSIGIALVAIIFLFLYSAKFKREFLIGNVTVSIISALAFIYGGVFSKNPEISLIPAVLAFLFHLGRELIKDMEDVKGDQALRSETFPIAYGIKNSQFLASTIFLVLIILTIFPYKLKIFSIYYLILVLMMDFVLFYIILSLWNNPSRENLGSLSRLLKFEMLLGLLAIFVGSFS